MYLAHKSEQKKKKKPKFFGDLNGVWIGNNWVTETGMWWFVCHKTTSFHYTIKFAYLLSFSIWSATNFKNFLLILWILRHAPQSHSSPHLPISTLCLYNLPWKRKEKIPLLKLRCVTQHNPLPTQLCLQMFCRESLVWCEVSGFCYSILTGLLSDVFLLPYPALWRYCSLGSERPGLKLLIL